MSRIRFFTDEDIYGAVAVALRRAGFDAVSTPETDRLGESDESSLLWAADEGRALVTFNVTHLAGLIRSGFNRSGTTRASSFPVNVPSAS